MVVKFKPTLLLTMLLAVALVTLQSLSIVHAGEHCDGPLDHDHTHNGIPCAVSVLADRDIDTLPQDNASPEAPFCYGFVTVEAETAMPEASLVALPSARAPPSA
ncbi:MAG: hypothetical protein MRY72_11300 [Aquisalinus sp.]|nr:hypothetical protein [Aquisalinus sp.]